MRLDESIGVVRADPDRLQQVVWNLLSNAVKFTPSGGQITVDVARRGVGVEIIVRDSGIGIRPEFLPHVFDRFRQAETVTTRQHTGLGLGLAIARQLVELHGGSIRAESDGEGLGATFIVSLPLAGSSESTIEPRVEREDYVDALREVEVLLVEDEGATGLAEQRFLQAAGANVRVAATASEAREAYSLRRPDVIVSDVGLPGEDGYVLIRSIRALEHQENLRPVPAIAVTAFARDEDRGRALAAGFDEHVAKPIDPGRLIRVLAQWAGNRDQDP
jgi:CheY-like chemotaxis protein